VLSSIAVNVLEGKILENIYIETKSTQIVPHSKRIYGLNVTDFDAVSFNKYIKRTSSEMFLPEQDQTCEKKYVN
jgi:hypothetical protein